ncbi:MAG: peptidylprolyl isomerase SurA [Alteromonadaceae bacterium]|nr:peptidylprolyl isomerase SurA [Alteromonadaceae bacterium]
MKNSLKLLALTAVFIFNASIKINAEEIELDSVAAIVNSGVVLESEVLELIKSIKTRAEKNNQELPSENALRIQVLEKLINDTLMLQMGERMGVQVGDAQLDQTLTNIATNDNLTLEEFRQAMVADGVNYENYRESVRNELISGDVRQASVRRRIYISPQEVANLLTAMKEQTSDDVEYELGHILIEFPVDPSQDDINSAKSRADKVIDLLNSGSDFAKIAIASSSDESALEGGNLGWKSINEIPTLFAELVDGQKKEEVYGPIRTGLGFSIIKILDIRGRQIVEIEEIKSRHILVEPTIILSEAKAEALLQGYLDQVNAGADFAELAKAHSEGPSAVRGGDLGWAEPSNYDPAYSGVLVNLKVDEYSKPFRTSHGWHLAQLTGRRTLDATKQMNENKARQIIYKRKFNMESARWIKETREEAYIEVVERGSK